MKGTLRPQEGDGGDVARLKGELQALLLAMQERIQSLEAVQEQQDSAIQVTLQPNPKISGRSRRTAGRSGTETRPIRLWAAGETQDNGGRPPAAAPPRFETCCESMSRP